MDLGGFDRTIELSAEEFLVHDSKRRIGRGAPSLDQLPSDTVAFLEEKRLGASTSMPLRYRGPRAIFSEPVYRLGETIFKACLRYEAEEFARSRDIKTPSGLSIGLGTIVTNLTQITHLSRDSVRDKKQITP